MKIFSDLNLNGRTPPRVQPKVGEWGPHRVLTTAAKKRMRLWVTLACIAAWTALFFLGRHLLRALLKAAQG